MDRLFGDIAADLEQMVPCGAVIVEPAPGRTITEVVFRSPVQASGPHGNIRRQSGDQRIRGSIERMDPVCFDCSEGFV